MSPPHKLKLLEQSKISPPPDTVPSTSLPLTFFDLPWLLFPPNQPLFFFESPTTTSHFTTTVLPNLKLSLSLTLRHFFPFAGNLLAPPPPAKPLLLYAPGDSVSLTVAESSADFHLLSGHHPRLAADFHPLVAQLEIPREAKRSDFFPLLAVKVTVFPGAGFCVGFSHRNVAADGRTFDRFVKFWAATARYGVGMKQLEVTHERCLIKDCNELQLTFLRQWWELKSFPGRQSGPDPVRATFVVGRPEIEKIKSLILSSQELSLSSPLLLSPYIVTCAHLWVCLTKARGVNAAQDERHELHYFGFIAGGIHRLDYQVPTSYFGNCIAFGRSEASRDLLIGENGLFFAAKSIGDKVKELNGNVLEGVEKWISDWNELFGSGQHVMVFGSPKVGLYGLDFGWGRPKKIEDVSIDTSGAVSLAESRDLEGGIEIGLSLPRDTMDIFTCLFTKSL